MTVTISPAVLLRDSLVTAGEGTLPSTAGAWPVFVSILPQDDNEKTDALCIYDTTGERDGRYQTTGETITHPGVQVRIRAASYPTGWAKAMAIVAHLDQILRETVQGYTLHAVTRAGPPLSLGIEPDGGSENQRWYAFSANATLTVTTTPTTTTTTTTTTTAAP